MTISSEKNKTLRAGAAQVDITPTTNIHVSGEVGWFRPGEEVVDPLYAKALVFASSSSKICLVVLDLTIITKEWTDRIRKEAARIFDLDPQAVMLHVTQNHSAPSLGHYMVDKEFTNIPDEMEWLKGGDSRYFEFAYERILEAIKKAHDSLEPVRLSVGSGIEGRVQFNRRAITSDGKVRMPGPRWPEPLGPTYIRYLEGPIDPEVGVLCVKNESQQIIAQLLHHTCHPVNVFPRQVFSADWPGAWSDQMRETFGPACVPLVINGCCGNINPWNPFDPDYQPDHESMGRLLAETTRNVIETLDVEEDVALDYRFEQVKIPFRPLDPVQLAEAQKLLSQHPKPVYSKQSAYAAYEENSSTTRPGLEVVDPKWMWAANLVSKHLRMQREPEMNYQIQAFRIGRTALLALPGEPFVEGQLQIKMASPAHRTLVAHCCNMYCGYIPTAEAFDRGGHEIDWSKLVPEALQVVTETSGKMIEELWK